MSAIDLWYVRVAWLDEAGFAACAGLLSPEESARCARFAFERLRQEYLVTRGLERGVLATYVARRPSELCFSRTELGRPILADARGVEFNLTNTNELVACAVTREREIGVDAEPLSRADQILGLAPRVFTAHERRQLERLPIAARRRQAVQLWTLKEAYIKARGLGMSLPVENIEMAIGPGAESPALRVFPPVEDDPARWALATVEIEGHLVSTCVELRADAPADAVVRRADLAELLARHDS